MGAPVFTAVVPSFNHRAYLEACIRSAFVSPFVGEILVVDDGSNDGSPKLLKTLEAWYRKKLRILPNGSGNNCGAHFRLNQLVEESANEWVAVLNSDDMFCPYRFYAISSFLEQNDADLLFGDLIIVDENDRRLGHRRSLIHNEIPWPDPRDVARSARRHDWIPLLEIQNIAATTTNMVFTRTLHRTVGGFRGYRYAHDWDFMIRASGVGKVRYVKQMLSYYRMHLTNTIDDCRYKKNIEVRRLFRQVEDDGVVISDRANLYNPYLRRARWLGVVVDERISSALDKSEFESRFPFAKVYNSFRNLGADVQYVYAPENLSSALDRVEMGNLILCLLFGSVDSRDVVAVSRGGGANEIVGDGSIVDQVVVRRDHVGNMEKGDPFPEGHSVHCLRLPAGSKRLLATVPSPPIAAISDPLRPTAFDPISGYTALQERHFPGFDYGFFRARTPPGKKVAFILTGFFAVGGVERVTLDIVRHLADEYFFVVVCTEKLAIHSGSLLHELKNYSDYYDLPEAVDQRAHIEALEFLRTMYDPAFVWIINGSVWQMNNFSELRRVFAEVPFCDQQVYDTDAGWIAYFNEPALCNSDKYVAINSKIRKTFLEKYAIPEDRVELIYPHFDSEKFHPSKPIGEKEIGVLRRFGISQDTFNVFFVGRLTEQKRPDRFLDIAREWRDSDLKFVLIGDGPLGEECRERINEEGLDNVTMVPFTDDLDILYSAANVLVITSDYEGLPVAMLEALAVGIPVFSTDVGDVRFLIEELGCGKVVVTGSNSLASEFKSWISGYQACAEKARRAAKKIRDRFSADSTSERYRTLFAKLCALKLDESRNGASCVG